MKLKRTFKIVNCDKKRNKAFKMATKNVSQPSASSQYQSNQSDTPPLGPRKTIFVLATVIGCIAILWPKIFYPMMFGGAEVPIKNNYINKDMKPGGKLIHSILFSMHSFTFFILIQILKNKTKFAFVLT